MNKSDCPPDSALSDYALGKGAEQVHHHVANHLPECSRCQAWLTSFSEVDDDLLSVLPLQGSLELKPEPFLDDPNYQRGLHAMVQSGKSPLLTEKEASGAASSPSAPFGIIGDYHLLEVLGEGGMGKVYLALQVNMEQKVAIKVLRVDRTNSRNAIERFHREMKACGKLEHSNVVRALNAGETNGVLFLAMELVKGFDLAQLLGSVGFLSVPNACEIIRQTADGLQHVYDSGLVHRDLKPSNLMLAFPGLVKILDLGLSRISDQGSLTETGSVMGTPDYMAPEQWDNSHLVDIRADLYSLGCVLYHLLTARAPFSGEQHSTVVEKMRAHLEVAPPPVCQFRKDVPQEVISILDRLLAKDRAHRFSTPQELGNALAPFVQGSDLSRLLTHCEKSGMDEDRASVQRNATTKSTVTETGPSNRVNYTTLPPSVCHSENPGQNNAGTTEPTESTRANGLLRIVWSRGRFFGVLVLIVIGGLGWGGISLFSDPPDKSIAAKPTPQPPLVLSWHGFLMRQRNNNWDELALRDRMKMHSGDQFRIVFRPSEDCYVYVINVDSQNSISLLFPHRKIGMSNHCPANQEHTIPDADQWITLNETTGNELLYLLASRKRLKDLEKLLEEAEGENTSRKTAEKLAGLVLALKEQAPAIPTRGMVIDTDKRFTRINHKPSGRELVGEMKKVIGAGQVVQRLQFQHLP